MNYYTYLGINSLMLKLCQNYFAYSFTSVTKIHTFTATRFLKIFTRPSLTKIRVRATLIIVKYRTIQIMRLPPATITTRVSLPFKQRISRNSVHYPFFNNRTRRLMQKENL